tara:strand:+ start:3871 stop:3978 length:108 start_codon:yes stop_codon:yes gene_type:complete
MFQSAVYKALELVLRDKGAGKKNKSSFAINTTAVQ